MKNIKSKKTDEELKDLWNLLRQIKDEPESDDRKKKYENVRNVLMEHFYYLVQRIAERMALKLKDVSVDDLTSYGVDGLFQAVENFDQDRGNKFQTYAVPRIRGSILDNIRTIDWVPRLVRQRSSKIEKARLALEAKLGRTPSDSEMASYFRMSDEEYAELKSKSIPVGCVSINAKINKDDDSDFEFNQAISHDDDPLKSLVKDEFFKKVMGKGFTKIEREIIALHYYDGMTMKEIADLKKFSESRISQMHAAIMKRLQQKMRRIPNYISDIEEAVS